MQKRKRTKRKVLKGVTLLAVICLIAGSFTAIATDSVKAETNQSNDSTEAEVHQTGDCYKEVRATHEGQSWTVEMPLKLQESPYTTETEWVASAEVSIMIGRFKEEQGELDIWTTTKIHDAPEYVDSDNINGFFLNWASTNSDADSLHFSQRDYHKTGKNLADEPLGGDVDEEGFEGWYDRTIEEYPNRDKAVQVGLELGKAALGEVKGVGTAMNAGTTAFNIAKILADGSNFGDEDGSSGERGYWYGEDNGYIDDGTQDDEYMIQSNKMTWHFDDPAEKNRLHLDIEPTRDNPDTQYPAKTGPQAHAFELIFDHNDWTLWDQPNDFSAKVNDNGNVELNWEESWDYDRNYSEVAGYRIESDSGEPWGEPYHGKELVDDSVEEGETYTYKLMVKMSYRAAPDECFDWYNTGASDPIELTITVDTGNSGGGDDGGGNPRPPGPIIPI